MAPNGFLTLAYAYDFAQTKLAREHVKVEIGAAAYRIACAEPALREYNAKRPYVGRAVVPEATAGAAKYGPIDTRHPCFVGVADCRGVEQREPVVTPSNPFDPFYQYRVPGQRAGELILQAFDNRSLAEVSNDDFQWTAAWEPDNHFYLYLRVPTGWPLDVGYEWHGKYLWEAPAPLPTVGVLLATQVPEEDVQWILDYSVALAKEVVARARGKFGGVPEPEGTSETDATVLLEESRTTLELLTAQMARRRRPLSPLVG